MKPVSSIGADLKLVGTDTDEPGEFAESDYAALIEDGVYEVRCLVPNHYKLRGKNKLALPCEVLRGPLVGDKWVWEPGSSLYVPPNGCDHPEGVILRRQYNVARVTSDGRYYFARMGDYARDWITVTGKRIRRMDRLSPDVFKGRRLLVRTRTVTTNWKRDPLSPATRYSVIDAILEVLD
jgi:hypothetical protein